MNPFIPLDRNYKVILLLFCKEDIGIKYLTNVDISLKTKTINFTKELLW